MLNRKTSARKYLKAQQLLGWQTALLCLYLGLLTPLAVQGEQISEGAAPAVVTTTVEPWGFFDENGKQSGILVDFVRTLMANAGLALDNKLKPYPRVIHEIATGQAELAVLFAGPQSDAIGQSLGKLTAVRVIIVMRAGEKALTTLEDFEGLKIGYVRGSRYGSVFDDNPLFKHVAVSNADQGLRMLMSGRIDAMASTEHSLLYASYHSGIASADLRVALSPVTASAHLYVSRHALNAPWLPAVQAALDAMRENGSLHRALYQNVYWPYESFCFAGGQCLSGEASQ